MMCYRKQGTLVRSKAQAALEIAILGSLILVVFNMLLSFGQRLEGMQKIKMEAFRKAMRNAYYRNAAVTYTMKQDTRSVDLFSGFGNGQPTVNSASASVMWQKGMPGTPGTDTESNFVFYEVNGRQLGNATTGLPRFEKEIVTATGKRQKVKATVGIYKEDARRRTSYTTGTQNTIKDGVVFNNRTATLRDRLTTTYYVRKDIAATDDREDPNDPANLPVYAYNVDEEGFAGGVNIVAEGAYLDDDNRVKYNGTMVNNEITRERNWVTPIK